MDGHVYLNANYAVKSIANLINYPLRTRLDHDRIFRTKVKTIVPNGQSDVKNFPQFIPRTLTHTVNTHKRI